MTSLVERAPADFLADVASPVNIEAEQRVCDYLRNTRRWPCIDRRDKCLAWDFELYPGGGAMFRLDVKADSYVDESGRVPFEDCHVYRDGSEKAGWGRNQRLDLVAVVGTTSWRCVFVRLPAFRALIGRAQVGRTFMPATWKPIDRENKRGGYRTKGWAVPLDEAWRAQAVFHVAELPNGGL